MKKRILTALTSGFALAVLIPASSFALSAKTDISGKVTNNGSGVSGAKVIVICDNNVKRTTTDSHGNYLVQFSAKLCPNGAMAQVTATKGKKGGNNDGKVNDLTGVLNVALINVSLPEFGLITAGGATLASGAAFAVVRRRQLSGHQG